MQSPPLELVLDVVHLGTRNLLRNTGDADGDTISEIIRGVVQRTPYGKQIAAVVITGIAIGFHHHICDPIP